MIQEQNLILDQGKGFRARAGFMSRVRVTSRAGFRSKAGVGISEKFRSRVGFKIKLGVRSRTGFRSRAIFGKYQNSEYSFVNIQRY